MFPEKNVYGIVGALIRPKQKDFFMELVKECDSPVYMQPKADSPDYEDFKPGLSIIDILMNHGRDNSINVINKYCKSRNLKLT